MLALLVEVHGLSSEQVAAQLQIQTAAEIVAELVSGWVVTDARHLSCVSEAIAFPGACKTKGASPEKRGRENLGDYLYGIVVSMKLEGPSVSHDGPRKR
jgi:hypothetical protein